MIKEPCPVDGVHALGYQVLLVETPPKAEFHVFKFHEQPVLKADTCERLINLSSDNFLALTETEPREFFALLDTLGLPESVAKFLQQAKKCISS
jgi:hypothetical protein